MDATVAKFDVFFSHNSRDRDLVQRIAERLRREGVEPWLDRWELVPGGAWQEELGTGLDASSACAVFVGPDDLGDWELQEVAVAIDRAARDRGFRVFPVLLPGVHEPFDPNRLPHFLRTRTWVDFRRGYEDRRALQDLIHAVKGIPFGPEANVVRRDDVCPYRGLEVFDTEHADFYFGRDGEIQRLLEQLKTNRFLAVLGPSGSGKSSLVRAGLLPALLRGAIHGRWQSCVVRPGAAPLTALAAALAPCGAMQATLDGLRADTRSLHLALAQMVGADAPQERVVVVVDQLEEVFTLCHDDNERRALFSNLIHAASAPAGPGVVVATIRADFYQRCAPYPELAQLVSSQGLLIGPMTRDALRQAIEEPARRVGLLFEEGLIDLILDAAGGEPGALPLLEYALLALWECRRGTMLTLEGYRETAGVHGALAKRAEELVTGLSPAEQELARRILLRLTQPGEGTEDTRRRARLSELRADASQPDAADDIVSRLVDARLLVTSAEPAAAGEAWIEVSHEALIRAWPRMRAWLDEDRAKLVIHRRVTEATEAWERLGRDEEALYRGPQLAEAESWFRRYGGDLNRHESDFVQAGIARRERERRRRTHRLIATGAALVMGVVIAATTALVATQQRNRAESERRLALSREVAMAAVNEMPLDPQLGLLLALEAARNAPTLEAAAALRQALLQPRELYSPLRTRAVERAAFSPDGQWILTVGAGDSRGDFSGLAVWNARTGKRHAELAEPRTIYGNAVFHPGGQLIAANVEDHVSLFTLDGTLVRNGPGSTAGRFLDLSDAPFSADGSLIVTTTGRKSGAVWNVETGRTVVRLRSHGSEFSGATLSGDGRYVAASTEDLGYAGQLWDARTGRSLAQLDDGDPRFSPDGRRLLTEEYLWTVPGARRLARLPGFDISFSDNGKYLVQGTRNGVRLFSASTGRRVHGPIDDLGSVSAPAFSRDGRFLLRRHAGGGHQVVSVPTADQVATVPGRTSPDYYYPAAFSPAGNSFLTSDDEGVHVFASPDWRMLRFGDPKDVSTALAVSGDSAVIAARDAERRSKVVHVTFDATGRAPHVWALRPFAPDLQYLGLSDDGRFAVSVLPDGDVVKWVTDPWRRVAQIDARLGSYSLCQLSPDLERASDSQRCMEHQVSSPLAVSRDGLVIAARGSGWTSTWHAEGGRNLHNHRELSFSHGSSLSVSRVAISSDGRRVASTSNTSAVAWETRTGKILSRLEGHTQPITSLQFSLDGRWLLTTSEDHTARVWHPRTGATVSLLRTDADDVLSSAAMSPDNAFVVTSSDDGTLRAWETRTGRKIATLLAGTGTGSLDAAVAWDGTGETVVSARAGRLYVIPCDVCASFESLRERADRGRTRGLSAAERSRFLHE
jgi:WD40 repeat protein